MSLSYRRVKRRALRAFCWTFSDAGARVIGRCLVSFVVCCGLIEVAYNVALAVMHGVHGAANP